MPRPNNDETNLMRLRDHYAHHGVLPSYAGISKVVGFRATTAAVKLGQRLCAAGYLRTGPGGKVVPTTRFLGLPVMASPVRAGAPDAIEAQMPTEMVTLEGFLNAEPSKTVLIRVKGDSMRDAGILDGDMAVVERARTASIGQFVVAVVDGEFTLKEYRFENKRPILIAHNPSYAPIRPKAELEIFGIVQGIVRKLGSSKSIRATALKGARK